MTDALRTLLLLQFGAGLLCLLSIHLVRTWALLLGAISLAREHRERSPLHLHDLLSGRGADPISILIAAEGSAEGVLDCVKACLSQQHPRFEVVVACPGRCPELREALCEAFPPPCRLTLADHDEPTVAGALRGAAQEAKYPILCSVRVGVLLHPNALLRMAAAFQDDTVRVVLGPLRVGLGAVSPWDSRPGPLPKGWTACVQVVESQRVLTEFAGWASLGFPGLYPPACRAVRVSEPGGGDWDAAGDEWLGWARGADSHRGVFALAEPLGWVVAQPDLFALRAERRDRQRLLWRALATAGDGAASGPRTRVALAWLAAAEAAAPLVWAGVVAAIPLLVLAGSPALGWWVAYACLAWAFGMLQSQAALAVEASARNRRTSARERFKLLAAACFERCVVEPVLMAERAAAIVHWLEAPHAAQREPRTLPGGGGDAVRPSSGQGCLGYLRQSSRRIAG